MNESLAHLLVSPETGNSLAPEIFSGHGGEIVCGRLIDSSTGSWFRIESGIVDLMPFSLRDHGKHESFARRYNLQVDSREQGTRQIKPGDVYARQMEYFSTHYDQYENEVVESPFYRVLDEMYFGAWVEKTVVPGDFFLEVGCGSGRQTVPLTRREAKIVGVDVSENSLLSAREKVTAAAPEAEVAYVLAVAENLPVKEEAFDAATIYGSLHHFSNPGVALLQIGRALKFGGKFFILEPHASPVRFLFDLAMRLRPLWQEESNNQPLFTEKMLRKWLNDAEIEARFGYSTFVPPHLLYLVGQRGGGRLLGMTDALCNRLPLVKRLGGVIIAAGTKRSTSVAPSAPQGHGSLR